ncbi:DoxX family protein [Paenibacillus daejeonensis]|uniref:DoxX family protein n=1 Tax=Paenibacillus daejeonensis TaxID=135193 RepID=UPI00036567BE|nr:DoxX family protein [Paenibacillus daejeonensis]
MSKRNKLIFWIATALLSLGMLNVGIVQLIRLDVEVETMTILGFPPYIMTVLGVSKILGVIAILIPNYPLLKEWAYAGFFFTLAGALISHIILDQPFESILLPSIFLMLTVASWFFRPASRKTHTSYLNHKPSRAL